MSKHLGNVLEPIPLMEEHGADAVRWYFAASGSPWSTRRIGSATLEEIVRKVLLTYWNTVSFLVLYANAAAAQDRAWRPAMLASAPPPASRPLLDRWVLSELTIVTSEVTAALEEFDSAAVTSRRSWTTCPTGMCAGPGAGSGTGRARRKGQRPLPRCTGAWRPSPG